MKNPFKGAKSLSDLQDEDERLQMELSVAQKRAAIRKLEERGVGWKPFSKDGTKRGISWSGVLAWFRSH